MHLPVKQEILIVRIYVKLLGAANISHRSKAGKYVVMEDWWHRGRKVTKMLTMK